MRLLVLGLISSLLALGAAADRVSEAIATYNAVINTSDQDTKLIAARELGEAAMTATERPDAALLAFEAAKTLCLANACETAQPFANWAVSEGGSYDGVPYEDFILLSAYTDWRVDANKTTRAALDRALTSIVNTDPSLLSVIAFQTRYSEDLAAEAWERAASAAEDAVSHFKPVKEVIGQQWSHARLVQISSAFNHEPDLEQVFAFARLERELNELHHAYHEAASEEPLPAWVDDNRYAAEAWRLATETYFKSTTHKKAIEAAALDADIVAIVDYETAEPDTVSASSDRLPLCDGELRMRPRLSYPAKAQRHGQFGAVIMDLTLKDGEVADVETLAAVPSAGFKDRAARTVAKWSWKPNVPRSDIGTRCSLDRNNMILPLVFALD
ncbi:MAG: energy transducer TonB [Henriciella sp.]|nr:energy transducer TonB [Henriciella sp.]